MKTKSAIYQLATCFLSSLLILQLGCKKDKEEEPPPESDIVIADNTKVIDQNNWQNSFVTMDSSTYTYTFNSNINSMNLKVDDIMVSVTGEGLLRKVISINTIDNQVEVQTEQATLADVIEKGQISIDTPLTISNIKSIEYHYAGISLDTSNLKQTGNTNFNWDINTVLYDEDNNLNTTIDQIRLEGDFNCDWNLLVFIDFSILQGLKEVKCGFKSEENLNLKLIAGLEYSLSKSVDLVTINFNPIYVQVGPLPVIFLPKFQIKAGIDGYANASIITSLEQGLSFDAGIQYLKDEGWATYKTFDKSFDFAPPQLNMNAGAEAYLKPELTLKIYGIAGPYANLKLYGKLNADLLQTPWWKLYGGLKMGAGAKAEIFGDLIFDFTVSDLINYELLIAQAETGDNSLPIALFEITPTSGTTSTVFNFDASESYDNEDPPSALQVRWDWENDGDWDTQYSTNKTITHQYSQEDTYTVKMEVQDSGELTDNTTNTIIVSIDVMGEPCPGIATVTYEGQTYNTVQISNQCWFKENLNVGTMLTGSQNPSNNGINEKYCYSDNPANCTIYGGLYKWNELMQYSTISGVQGICPSGWHIPTDEELTELTYYLGGLSLAGGKMKEAGNTHWNSNVGATNTSGFTVFGGGQRYNEGSFIQLKNNGRFWSSTNYNNNEAWCRVLNANNIVVDRVFAGKEFSYSIRCLKD